MLSLFAVYEVYNFVGLRTRVVVVEVHQSQQQFSDKLSYTRDLLHETSALNHTPISNISVRRTPKLTQDYVIPEIERSRPSNDSKSFIKQRKLLDDSTKHYKIFVGILSAKRDPPTVVRMAKELVRHVTEGDYKFATWISHSAAGEENVISQLKEVGFKVYISNKTYHELEPDRVHITFGDSFERMKWRTTHGKSLHTCNSPVARNHGTILICRIRKFFLVCVGKFKAGNRDFPIDCNVFFWDSRQPSCNVTSN